MTYVVERTWVTGELVTAAYLNQYLRDNVTAIASLAGVTDEDTSGADSRNANSYGDCAGTANRPTVTVTTGTSALVIVSCIAEASSTAVAYMSYAVTGASTVAASDAHSGWVNLTGSQDSCISFARVQTGLTAGSNTFTGKYKSSTGTSFFNYRRITVYPTIL